MIREVHNAFDQSTSRELAVTSEIGNRIKTIVLNALESKINRFV